MLVLVQAASKSACVAAHSPFRGRAAEFCGYTGIALQCQLPRDAGKDICEGWTMPPSLKPCKTLRGCSHAPRARNTPVWMGHSPHVCWGTL